MRYARCCTHQAESTQNVAHLLYAIVCAENIITVGVRNNIDHVLEYMSTWKVSLQALLTLLGLLAKADLGQE